MCRYIADNIVIKEKHTHRMPHRMHYTYYKIYSLHLQVDDGASMFVSFVWLADFSIMWLTAGSLLSMLTGSFIFSCWVAIAKCNCYIRYHMHNIHEVILYFFLIPCLGRFLDFRATILSWKYTVHLVNPLQHGIWKKYWNNA